MIAERDLLDRFEAVKRQREGDWLVRCPAHEDGRPSLHVTRKPDRWLLHCLADCEIAAVLDAARLTYDDLFESNGRPALVAEYAYRDEQGCPLYIVERYQPKAFAQRTPDGGRSLKGVRRVPYRLPEITAAVKAGEQVWIAEGEKDVHALVRAGAVATCHAGGTGGVRQWREFATVLYGADVTVVADADDAGRKCASTIAAVLHGIAASVTVVEAARGKDAADHLAHGLGLAEFVTADAPRGLAAHLTDLPTLVARPAKPPPWVVEEIAASGKLTVISGAADVGKSWLAIACCAGVGTGEAVAGLLWCERGRALYVDAEMGKDEFSDRVRGLGLTGHEMRHLDAAALGIDMARPADRELIGELMVGYSLVVLDSLRALAPAMHENDSDSMGPIVMAVRNLARETGAAVVLLHHRGDSDKSYRGSTAIKDQSDALLSLWDGSDEGVVGLRCRGGRGRVRFAPAPEDRWFQRDPFSGALSPSVARELAPGPSKGDEVERKILAALPAKSKNEVARKLGMSRDHGSFRAAWSRLEDDGKLVELDDGSWGGRAGQTPREPDCPPSPPDGQLFGGEIVDAEVVCDRCGGLLADVNGRWVCVNRDCAEAGR